MPAGDVSPKLRRPPQLVERCARRIANARSVVFGMATTFILLSLAGAARA